MNNIKVVDWISYDEAENKENSFGGLGGWFDNGMRWKDYLEACTPKSRQYPMAIRKAVIERQLKEGGDWHQSSDTGVPLFSDGTVATFSYRSWGDIMAAIWSQEDDCDYSYMSFYMSRLVERVEGV